MSDVKVLRPLTVKGANKPGSVTDKNSIRNVIRERFGYNFTDTTPTVKPATCDWCRQAFNQEHLGIPVKMVNKSDGSVEYRMIDYTCSFECSYALIRDENKKKTPGYSAAEPILAHLYSKMYPNEKLHPAPDWRTLRNNGGWHDYSSGQPHKYRPTTNISKYNCSTVFQS